MKKAKRKRREWMKEEIETAKSLYESGMNMSEIGEQLGRPSISVNTKLQALGVHKVEKVYLYDIKHLRPNIINVDESKKVAHKSNKKLLFKCSTDGCNTTKTMTVQSLVKQGFSCPNCSTGISYSESMFTAYLQVKNIPYETQVIFEDLSDRRYDFRIKLDGVTSLVETHGEQHYLTEDRGYFKVETIQESDKIKRQYAKDNNINYIELDCRDSTFEFIRKQIKDNNTLPNITDNDIPKILELMEPNSKYNIKDIIKMYESGKSTVQIGEKLNVHSNTVCNILKRNNIKVRNVGSPKRMVRLIETNQIYVSIAEAQRQTGIAYSNIWANCNGKYKSAGKHHITGKPLHWEYVD